MPQPQKQKSNDNNRDTESGGRRIEKKHTHTNTIFAYLHKTIYTLQARRETAHEIPEREWETEGGKAEGGVYLSVYL